MIFVVGISFPSAGQQINLLRSTYKEAGVDPNNVQYVEAHGTGTKVGDPIECHAIKTVFAKNRDEPLLIGSIKSNAGHAEPASGIMGLSKVILIHFLNVVQFIIYKNYFRL